MHDIHTQSVLNPTSVGSNFLLDAHISVKDVNKVKKYSHQICIPKIKPGTIIQAFVSQEKNSTVL